MTWEKLLPMLWAGTVDTLYMTFWSSLIAYLVGLPLGVLHYALPHVECRSGRGD